MLLVVVCANPKKLAEMARSRMDNLLSIKFLVFGAKKGNIPKLNVGKY
jgi:hypothetical protein